MERKITYAELAPKSNILNFFTIFQCIMVIITIPYMIAWLNVVFTYEFLTTADYPRYSDDLFMGLGTFWFDRYLTDWWIVLSDALYIIIVTQQAISVANVYILDFPGRTLNIFILGTFTAIKIVTLATRIYQIAWCSKFNICRGDPPNPNTPDPIFIYMLSMNAAWLVFLVIYALLWTIGTFENDYKDYLDQFDINIERFMESIKDERIRSTSKKNAIKSSRNNLTIETSSPSFFLHEDPSFYTRIDKGIHDYIGKFFSRIFKRR